MLESWQKRHAYYNYSSFKWVGAFPQELYSFLWSSSKMTLQCQKYEFPCLKRKRHFMFFFLLPGKMYRTKTQTLSPHRSLLFPKECPGLNSPEKAVLSAVGGARLPLPSQEVFGFEVKHVSVCLSLLALAIHVFLGVLHHLLCLLCHLRNKQRWHRHEFSSN